MFAVRACLLVTGCICKKRENSGFITMVLVMNGTGKKCLTYSTLSAIMAFSFCRWDPSAEELVFQLNLDRSFDLPTNNMLVVFQKLLITIRINSGRLENGRTYYFLKKKGSELMEGR